MLNNLSLGANLQKITSLPDLNALLEALEANMESEIAQIKEKFARKKAPVLDAMAAKGWHDVQ